MVALETSGSVVGSGLGLLTPLSGQVNTPVGFGVAVGVSVSAEGGLAVGVRVNVGDGGAGVSVSVAGNAITTGIVVAVGIGVCSSSLSITGAIRAVINVVVIVTIAAIKAILTVWPFFFSSSLSSAVLLPPDFCLLIDISLSAKGQYQLEEAVRFSEAAQRSPSAARERQRSGCVPCWADADEEHMWFILTLL